MYYIIDKNTRQLIRQSQTPFNVDEAVQPPAPYIQLKRTDNDAAPAYNASTEKLVYQFTDSDATFTRNFAYAVVPLSQAELDAKAEAATDEATRLQIKAIYLDLKNGVGTAGERLVRLEKSVAWLLRQYVK